MAVREILLFGNETLRQRSEEVTEFNEELWTLLDDMYDTMTEANGIGLAAPQIGVLKRVVVIDVDDDNGIIELVNPVITLMRGKQFEDEGCLSCPGKSGVVKRPMKVKVKAKNRYGRPVEYTGRELLARAFCHEIDHLNGILYADKVIEWTQNTQEETEE
ncbi:MAG: peptide deformylase [Oscillospiraceae bacterium]|nr:peptide deformylase [Oscillospiraceae bacterium]